MRPPNKPIHIMAGENPDSGIKKAPIVTAITIINLIPQNPF